MRVAVVHPGTLLGKEVCQQLAARGAAWAADLQLFSTVEEEVGTLAEVAGAAGFVGRADEESLAGVGLAFLCGAPGADREALARLPASALAVLLSPAAEPAEAPFAVAGLRRAERAGERRLTSPHPAAVALALLVAPLAGFRPRRLVATAALPVTAESDAGLDDLFEETRRILTFQGAPASGRGKPQRAFNLLPADDDAAAVEAQLGALLGGELTTAVQLVRAGVFHGLVVGAWVELEERPAPDVVRRALAGPAVELARRPGVVGPVTVAGGERLTVGAVRAAAGGYSIWAAMDNLLRGGALNAVELAEEMLADSPA